MNRPAVLRARSMVKALLVLTGMLGALRADLGAQAAPGLLGDQAPEARTMEYLEGLWRSGASPGASVTVAVDDRVVLSIGLGYADLEHLVPARPTTVYNVGSVSKVQTAVAVMQLVEEGRVRLDAPVRDYVPAFPEKRAPVTVRHLLTHTSGIRHYAAGDFADGIQGNNTRPYQAIENAIEIFADDPLLFEPGTFYRYTSYGVNLLQGVIEAASGQPFEAYMREHVWGPAGMAHSSFDVTGRVVPNRAGHYLLDEETGEFVHHPYADVSYKFASGGMLSTSEDLARFVLALNHGRLLEPATVAEMFSQQIGPDVRYYREDRDPDPMWFGQGLIWRLRSDSSYTQTNAPERRMIYHCGTVKGNNACVINYPEEHIVVAAAENGYGPFRFPVLAQIADWFRQARDRD